MATEAEIAEAAAKEAAEKAAAESAAASTTGTQASTDTSENDERVAAAERKAKEAAQEAILERKKRQDAEAKVAEFEQSQLSEKEKAEAKAKEAEARAEAAEAAAKALERKVAITQAASTKNFANADLAYRLVKDEQFDESKDLGEQIDAVLTALAAENPGLLRQATSATNGQTRSGTTKSVEDYGRLSPQQIADMSDEEFAEMQRVLASS